MSGSDYKGETFLKETETLHNLRALEEIEKNPRISQRELSSRLGVALGITNSLLKALVRKGFIKIRGNNNRSLTYHLTHAGVLAKSALAVRWTMNTVDYYRQARQNIAEKLCLFADDGVKTVVLYGDGDLMEITLIVISEAGLQVRGVIGPAVGDAPASILGYPILSLEAVDVAGIDAIVVCDNITDGELTEIRSAVDGSTKICNLIAFQSEM